MREHTYKLRQFQTYFVLNGLWNGEEGMLAIPMGPPTAPPQKDGWYWLWDGMEDGKGPYTSEAAACRGARYEIDLLLLDKRKHWRIFFQGNHITDIPWQDDENGGLPQWCYNGDFIHIMVDLDFDKVEWVPPVGPAPTWEAKASNFKNNEDLYRVFDQWCREHYGCNAHKKVLTM
jgi:hypothetical protein